MFLYFIPVLEYNKIILPLVVFIITVLPVDDNPNDRFALYLPAFQSVVPKSKSILYTTPSDAET